MVMDSFRSIVQVLIVGLAGTAAISGAIVLNSFFQNKLKELFDNVNYFAFFFLTAGYFCYALGEVSYYVVKNYFQDTSSTGISDVYWVTGQLLILLSFLALAYVTFRNKNAAPTIPLLIGIGLVAVVGYIVFGVTLTEGETTFFSYFYPMVSSLIVATSLSVVLSSKESGGFNTTILFFLIASAAILVGDVLYTYGAAKGIYTEEGLLGTVGDIIYAFAYGMSTVAFITMRKSIKESTA